jgi:hypothetical protein
VLFEAEECDDRKVTEIRNTCTKKEKGHNTRLKDR